MDVENFEKLPIGNLKNYLLTDCFLSSSPKGTIISSIIFVRFSWISYS